MKRQQQQLYSNDGALMRAREGSRWLRHDVSVTSASRAMCAEVSLTTMVRLALSDG
jgi:hypothetical protein